MFSITLYYITRIGEKEKVVIPSGINVMNECNNNNNNSNNDWIKILLTWLININYSKNPGRLGILNGQIR